MTISSIALVNSPYTNVAKGSSKPSNPDALYIGEITRIVAGRAIVKIPKLNPLNELGPCDIFYENAQIGDTVLCSYIDGRYEHLVIIAKKHLATNACEILENRIFS